MVMSPWQVISDNVGTVRRIMKLGFSIMETVNCVSIDVVAKEVEDRGFDSLWMGEHTHIPVSPDARLPGGARIPESYLNMSDPYVALMLVASKTTSLIIGTGVSLALEHDVIALAKSTATLDRLSGGRLIMGVGVGWSKEELASHSRIPWSQRYGALEECVSALRELWIADESEYHGRYYDFGPLWSRPKPLSNPLSVYCGMGGSVGMAHAARWADGWMPMNRTLGTVTDGEFDRGISRFRQLASEHGRGHVPITVHAVGTPTPEDLHHFAELGIERTIVGGLGAKESPLDTTMPFLDHYAPFVSGL
jgi:probable F420-dependent oxidoreductase